jgi:hypothetical protein
MEEEEGGEEKVVNMYVYIIGEEIVSDYRNQLEEVA